jgi:predicted RNA binding protein YcfA (HicA-like mRNA interferase family)
MNSKKLIKLLTDNGWKLVRIDGSHHIFTKAGNPNNLAVPHPRKDLKLGTVKGLLKKAGL